MTPKKIGTSEFLKKYFSAKRTGIDWGEMCSPRIFSNTVEEQTTPVGPGHLSTMLQKQIKLSKAL